MGCSVSCAVFDKFTTFSEWVVWDKMALENVVHYLDYVLFSGQTGTG